MPPGHTSLKPSRTAPSSSDVARVIVGATAFVLAILPIAHGPVTWVSAIAFAIAIALLSAAIALPALLFRGIRGDWKGFTVWCGRGLVIVSCLLVLGHIRRAMQDRPPSLVESLRTGEVTIDRFLRAERAAAPAMFDLRMLRQQERGLRESLPESGFSNISLVEVTDGSGWLRSHIAYDGSLKLQGRFHISRGHFVLYYHRAGMASIGTVCSQVEEGCKGVERLLTAAEKALRARLGSGDLDGVLPENAACSTETIQVAHTNRHSQVRSCLYEPGILLTFARVDAATTIAALVEERTSHP